MKTTRRRLLKSLPTLALGATSLRLSAADSAYGISEATSRLTVGYRSNTALPTILADWRGTPVDDSGRFVNHEFPHDNNIFRFIDWQTKEKSTRKEKKNDPFRVRVERDRSFLSTDRDCLVWFGHASFYIRVGGVSFMTDPVFGNIFMRDRIPSLPVSPEYLSNLDAILLSHVHMDHADEPSMTYLRKRNLQSHYFCGLGASELINDWTGSTHVQEAGWFQQYDTTQFRGGRDEVQVFYLPARHWSRRGVFDENKQLWGSFVIKSPSKTIFWGGDSGFGSHFAEVGKLFPSIDVCIAGVGAYKPEWFMGQNHTSPRDAVRAADAMAAKTFIPMHYGTFDLGDEAPGDSVRDLEKIRNSNLAKCEIRIPNIGEIVWL